MNPAWQVSAFATLVVALLADSQAGQFLAKRAVLLELVWSYGIDDLLQLAENLAIEGGVAVVFFQALVLEPVFNRRGARGWG